MKYKVKWIEEYLGITRNMIRRYEKNEVKEIMNEGNLKELSQRKLGELDKKCVDLQSKIDLLNRVCITGKLPCCLEDVINEFGKKSE
mgnify:CR=1 FL=1